MGFLGTGAPLTWSDTEEYHKVLDYVRDHGVAQFMEVWTRVKDRKNDILLWGDEVEFHLARRSTADGQLKLSLRAHEIINKLEAEDELLPEEERMCTWHPEYGAWMVEATPSRPFGGYDLDLENVESSMRMRQQRISAALDDDELLISMPAWPMMGVGTFTEPPLPPGGPIANSRFLPDGLINPHPRFGTLTRNIRLRRGQNVNIQVPLYQDVKTEEAKARRFPLPSKDNCGKCETQEIYMDSMGFGMGACCLQVTFQARDLTESTTLYDQLAVLCPIFLALTAGTPILKGLLADTDVRWSTIAQSVDCRTPVELSVAEKATTLDGAEVAQRGSMKIAKSRYDSIDSYLSSNDACKPEYNDNETEVDAETLHRLLAGGVEPNLAKHIAHLFVRDPLVVFSDRIEVDDKETTEHFENIQSTNWQTMRWKPPPLNSDMGWRVEFRPMEMQLTDFENAAYTVMIVLMTRVILFFDLNLYVPISKVDENMKTAHKRDAVLEQKFYFRKNVVPLESQCAPATESDGAAATSSDASNDEEYELMTIEEILCGKGEQFPGLVPLIWAYLDIIDVAADARAAIQDYIDLIVARAKGDLPTLAKWTRDFVAKHPAYQQDSVIPAELANDLLEHCAKISSGEIHDEALLGKHEVIKRSAPASLTRADHLRQLTRGDYVAGWDKLDANAKKRRLRGASFHEDDVGMTNKHAYKCAVVLALIEKYANAPNREFVVQAERGFAGTKAFISK